MAEVNDAFMDEDPGFAFDADGNEYEIPLASVPQTPAGISTNLPRHSRGGSSDSAYERVRRDHEDAEQAGLDVSTM